MFRPVTILRARAATDMPSIGIKAGDAFYLARDPDGSLRAVKWDRVRWICSCGRGRCDHKLAVNTFVLEQSQQQPGDPGNHQVS